MRKQESMPKMRVNRPRMLQLSMSRVLQRSRPSMLQMRRPRVLQMSKPPILHNEHAQNKNEQPKMLQKSLKLSSQIQTTDQNLLTKVWTQYMV